MKPLAQHITESFAPVQQPVTEAFLDNQVKPADDTAKAKPSDDGTASIMRTEPAEE